MPIYLQHGNLIDYVPPTDTSTEDVVFMGGLVGIPQAFIPAGELGALSVDGVYMFNKKEGVAVNLGEVVKYCGTTKLAQDSNADLTLGVAVADAEADDFGVKVKINSVLPTDGGGGEVAIDTSKGLENGANGLAVNIGSGLTFGSCGELNATGGGGSIEVCTCSGLAFNDNGQLFVNVFCGCGLAFWDNGELYINKNCGLSVNDNGELEVNIANGGGLDFNLYGQLVATGGGGGGITLDPFGGLVDYGCGLAIKVCTASGLSIDGDGYLTYNG